MDNDLISRSALKKALKSNCDLCHDKNTNWCEHCCPLNDFEDLIDNAPTVEEITNEDIQQAIKEGFANGYEMAKEKFSPKQGVWKEDYTAKKKRVVACNKCHCLNIMGKSNFCPNCGADMRKDGAK